MSRGTNNSFSGPLRFGFGLDYGTTNNPNSNESNYVHPAFSTSHSFRPASDTRGGALGTQRSFEEWRFQRPSGTTSFPAPSHTPFLLVLDNEREWVRESPFRPRDIIPAASPTRATEFLYWNMPVPVVENNPRTNHINQKKVLEKLKKQIYNPPRRRFRNNLYYRDTPVSGKEFERDEDVKRCSICLEDFEPKQEVMVTPCKHMFHEECIVPWVNSNAVCPVCRFSLLEKTRDRVQYNSTTANMAPRNETTADDLLAIIRAMDETSLYL